LETEPEMVLERVAHYRAQAAKMRKFAEESKHEELRSSCTALAAQWEALAIQLMIGNESGN
jgi:hypothetical protein